eukprot:scaffold3.g6447.t1
MTSPTARELGPLAAGQRTEIDRASTELKGIQFRTVTAFNRLRDDVARLGGPADTVELRHRLADSSARIKALAAEFRQRMGQHPAKESSPAQKVLRDFQTLLRNAERLMETAKAREAASLPRPAGAAAAAAAAAAEEEAAAAAGDAERAALLEVARKQELLAVEGQLQFNEAIIEERDQAIGEIAGQIGEVHQIFQDLAVLVSDQGQMLDDIEANITRAAERTADATVQIARAERSQRSVRNKWCFLLVVAGAVLLVLLLVLLA